MVMEVMGIYYADTEQRVGEATACPQASVGAWMGQDSRSQAPLEGKTKSKSSLAVMPPSHSPCTSHLSAHPSPRAGERAAAGCGAFWQPQLPPSGSSPPPLAGGQGDTSQASASPLQDTRRSLTKWRVSGNEHWWHLRSMNYLEGLVKHTAPPDCCGA